MSLVIVLCVILNELKIKLSLSMFVAGFAFTDLIMILITNNLNKKVQNGFNIEELFTKKFPIAKLLLIEIGLFIVFLGIICGLSLGIEPVYKALEAYDNGISTDLSIPMRLWIISGGISLIIMILVGILIVRVSAEPVFTAKTYLASVFKKYSNMNEEFVAETVISPLFGENNKYCEFI